MGLLYTIIIGAICGYIADVLMRDNGFGLIVNIIMVNNVLFRLSGNTTKFGK